jgi:hypothetical protein
VYLCVYGARGRDGGDVGQGRMQERLMVLEDVSGRVQARTGRMRRTTRRRRRRRRKPEERGGGGGGGSVEIGWRRQCQA